MESMVGKLFLTVCVKGRAPSEPALRSAADWYRGAVRWRVGREKQVNRMKHDWNWNTNA